MKECKNEKDNKEKVCKTKQKKSMREKVKYSRLREKERTVY